MHWLLRGGLAGLAGTTAMTVTVRIEELLRPGLEGPIDYDAGDAPVIAASKVLRVQPRTPGQRRALWLLVRWGYGSFVGVGHLALARRLREPAATGAFFAGVQVMAFALLPALGGTPPPWRWRRDVLATSVLQHAVYAGAVGSAAYAIRTQDPLCHKGFTRG